MSKYKVLTDGNGSDLIQVVGLGIYVPLSGLEKVSADNVALSQKLGAAQHEVEALAATVEALRKAIMSNCCDDPSTSGQRLIELANKTPQQHLRDVRAEAGRAGFIAGADGAWQYLIGTSSPNNMTSHLADKYAASVKAGEK